MERFKPKHLQIFTERDKKIILSGFNHSKNTILHVACLKNLQDVLKAYFDPKSPIKVDADEVLKELSTKNSYGDTPLHVVRKARLDNYSSSYYCSK